MGALDLDGVRRHAAAAGRERRRPSGASRPPGGSRASGPSRRRPPASGARRRRLLGRAVAAVAAVLALAVAAVVVWGFRLTTTPQPDDPEHVDALLVLYTDPAVYEAALELAGQGRTDRLFVSGHLHPDGFETLCGAPAAEDPRLEGVSVECFSPDPVTTQGEVVHAAGRMEDLGLRSLGVLTHGRHLERSRLLAQRCWSGPGRSVAAFQYDLDEELRTRVQQTLYGTLSFLKVAVTPGCDQQIEWLQGPVDRLKEAAARGPVDDSVATGASAAGRATAGPYAAGRAAAGTPAARPAADPADWAAQAPVPGTAAVRSGA